VTVPPLPSAVDVKCGKPRRLAQAPILRETAGGRARRIHLAKVRVVFIKCPIWRTAEVKVVRKSSGVCSWKACRLAPLVVERCQPQRVLEGFFLVVAGVVGGGNGLGAGRGFLEISTVASAG
jgi:hypothetical protein